MWILQSIWQIEGLPWETIFERSTTTSYSLLSIPCFASTKTQPDATLPAKYFSFWLGTENCNAKEFNFE